jgi:hypothetical protein
VVLGTLPTDTHWLSDPHLPVPPTLPKVIPAQHCFVPPPCIQLLVLILMVFFQLNCFSVLAILTISSRLEFSSIASAAKSIHFIYSSWASTD